MDSCDYEVIRDPSIVYIRAAYSYSRRCVYIAFAREISNANTIEQHFCLKRCENKLRRRFRLYFFASAFVFSQCRVTLFTVIYTAAVSIAETERHCYDCIHRRCIHSNNASSPTSSPSLTLCIYRGLHVKSFEIHCAHKVF